MTKAGLLVEYTKASKKLAGSHYSDGYSLQT